MICKGGSSYSDDASFGMSVRCLCLVKGSTAGSDNAFLRAQYLRLSAHLFRGNLPPGKYVDGCEWLWSISGFMTRLCLNHKPIGMHSRVCIFWGTRNVCLELSNDHIYPLIESISFLSRVRRRDVSHGFLHGQHARALERPRVAQHRRLERVRLWLR